VRYFRDIFGDISCVIRRVIAFTHLKKEIVLFLSIICHSLIDLDLFEGSLLKSFLIICYIIILIIIINNNKIIACNL